MTLTIPYEHSPISVNTNVHGDLLLGFNDHPALIKEIFNQLIYRMSYTDIINVISPQSFEQIMEHYQTEYKEEQHDYSIN